MRLRIDFTRLDRWQELAQVLGRNKLRTALTALAVAWGIFMLIILLGAGRGLQNAVEYNFRDDATNSLFVRGGETSIPYKGNPVGKPIYFYNEDYDRVPTDVPEADHVTGRYMVWRGMTVTRGAKYSNYRLRGVHPDHQILEKTIMLEGRFINEKDIDLRRKVCVISEPTRDFYFGSPGAPGSDPALGQSLNVGGIAYQVVGIFTDAGSERELEWIYVPVSTAQTAYGGADRLHMFMLTLGDATASESKVIAERLRLKLAERHGFSPDDKRAVRVMNNLERIEDVRQIFTMIDLFVWILGLGTILAGVVGVSNIMLISVRERTKEFGIRKSLGATPWSIVGMVLQEAIALTAVAGYIGVIAGMGALELANKYIPDSDRFRDPSVDVSVVLVATAVLVVAGALAGYIPARQAARVKPVTALRDD